MTNSLEALAEARKAKAERANKRRIALEKQIARAVVKDALAAGYALGIDNGGDEAELENCSEFKKVVDEMFATDDEYLLFYKDGKRVGWVRFVYGNEGWDVMADWTVNIEAVLKGASEIADKAELRNA
jgi:hypothetical protein